MVIGDYGWKGMVKVYVLVFFGGAIAHIITSFWVGDWTRLLLGNFAFTILVVATGILAKLFRSMGPRPKPPGAN